MRTSPIACTLRCVPMGPPNGSRLNENYGIFFAAGVPIQAATAESRRACVAAAHFVADPFDEAHPATDASHMAR